MKAILCNLILLTAVTSHIAAQQQSDMEQAHTLYEAGKYSEAIALVDKIIDLQEDTFNALLIKGNSYQKEEKYVAALQVYESAQLLNSESVKLNTYHGAAYINLQQYSEAEKKLNKAIKIDPLFSEAHYYKGNVYYFNFNINAAIRSYNEAIKLNPNYRDALFMRAASFAEMGKYEAALRDYNNVLRLDPSLSSAAFNIAVLHLQSENFEKSAQLLANIDPSTLPNQRDYYFYLGEALYFAGKKDEACTQYHIAKEHGDEEASEIYEKYCLTKTERKTFLKTRTIRMTF